MKNSQMVSEQEMFRLIEQWGYKVRRKGVDVFVPREQLTPRELRQIQADLVFLAKLFIVHAKYLVWLEARLAESLPGDLKPMQTGSVRKRRGKNSRD